MNVTLVDALPAIPARDPRGHKGTFGTVLVVGGHLGVDGERTMLGAPTLAANAALKSGAGCAILAMPVDLLSAGLTLCPAATGIALPLSTDGRLHASAAAERIDAVVATAQALVLGPGFGQGFAQQQIVVRLLAALETPIVLDADGLNAIATLPDAHRDIRAPLVLTPHPGEYQRLAKALGIQADAVDPERRVDAAADLARRLGAVVVLKGPHTVVSDGLRAWVNTTGTAALAIGGSGDVLAGMIGGLIAQFVRGTNGPLSLFDCASLAVAMHGAAAEAWSAEHGPAGMLPTDLVQRIPDSLDAMRTRGR